MGKGGRNISCSPFKYNSCMIKEKYQEYDKSSSYSEILRMFRGHVKLLNEF
jgi:hypothetical protein